MIRAYSRVIDFWFDEIKPEQWWQKDAEIDQVIRRRFGTLHSAAVHCELVGWRDHALGRLAEIIVLDQFSRNIYRDEKESFSYDNQALALAQEATVHHIGQALSMTQKTFIYMPYMHSESSLIHQLAIQLFSEPGLESNLEFELQHKAIIDRFGRYPHRNKILGRVSTEEELVFLQEPGSSF